MTYYLNRIEGGFGLDIILFIILTGPNE